MSEHLSTDLTSHTESFRRAKRLEGAQPIQQTTSSFP